MGTHAHTSADEGILEKWFHQQHDRHIDELSIMSYHLGYVYYFAFDIHICDSKLIVSLVLVPVI